LSKHAVEGLCVGCLLALTTWRILLSAWFESRYELVVRLPAMRLFDYRMTSAEPDALGALDCPGVGVSISNAEHVH